LAGVESPSGEGKRNDQEHDRERTPGKACGGVVLPGRRLKNWGSIVAVGFLCWGNDSGGGKVLGDDLIFIHVQIARVGTDEALVKDAAGELVEMFVFEGAQHAGADFRGEGYVVKADSLFLSLLLQLGAE